MNRRSTITVAVSAVAVAGIAGGIYLGTGWGLSRAIRSGIADGFGEGNGQGTGGGERQGTGAGNPRGPLPEVNVAPAVGVGPAPAIPAIGRGSPGGPDDGSDSATTIRAGDLQAELAAIPRASTLPATDRDGLVWMREEEKLAHDVYIVLAKRWGNGPFSNIATAEATHADAVRQLLERYGIADPSSGMGAGTFANPAFASLYQALVTAGSTSYIEGVKVGAQIEELDIRDLKDRASLLPDIAKVYRDLERGSRNHLRAFARQIERQGAHFNPTHLTKAEYDAIVSEAIETGDGR